MGAQAAPSLDALEKAHFDAEWAAAPVNATALGLHATDGKLDDVSAAVIAERTARLHRERDALAALDVKALPQRRQDDRDILVASIDRELIENERIQSFRHNPDFYVNLATAALYSLIDRDFAPLPVRMRDVVAREAQIPAMLATGAGQLDQVPAVFVEISKEDLAGAITFVRDNVPAAFADVKDKALQARLRATTRTTLAALKAFQARLDAIRPGGTFVLGADTIHAMLATEMVDTPIATIIAAGRAQLAKDQAAFHEAARAVDPAHPDQALSEIRRDHVAAPALNQLVRDQLTDAQTYVTAHRLVTLPNMTLPEVLDTPGFERSLITAATDWPGAFETKATTSFYYVTPIDPKLSPAQAEESLEDDNTPSMLNITVHEAMPGHFVQGLYLRANPDWSLTRKSAQSYATTEGWAHYTEQMMIEQGFHASDARLHLAQLQDALLRDCRFLASFGMHTQGMTLQQATGLMQHECFQSSVMAYKEARRGTADPEYYSYLLGKLMILHLRQDMKATQGNAFSLAAFHDALLGAGLVPMKMIRREMTGRDGAML
ncbi:hypothetical protein Tasa_024_002 [Tanticharoenia sakaeratensis NBRC 103193]|uniref:DUF885 domain-containing protein n=2 Tax=Tanticharoenia TaxID=444052 RepID=A0A0D6MM54_9PROT|nr:hypothetical protein Tasa_024_002 [Tanticharoenia sakaeratensis NBRC 103193]GBQ24504.1 hypothetical protein AA103193_2773 [Tanticharoenia sakaeratensis NBRC 103193]